MEYLYTPKVLLHFSIMLHGAAQATGTRPARALISWCYTTVGGASSPDKISNNVNNINNLKFYHLIRGNLVFFSDYVNA